MYIWVGVYISRQKGTAIEGLRCAKGLLMYLDSSVAAIYEGK